MGLFKYAAARGIAHELVRSGMCAFPTKEAMDAAADAVADSTPAMPEIAPPEGHDPEQVAQVANQLIQIAHELMAQSGAQGAQGAAEVAKTSSENDYDTLAHYTALECMDKVASGLIHGGDKQNTPGAAAETSEIAKLDAAQRPQGKYHDGRAQTSLHTEGGAIGDLSSNPVQPSNSPSGTNSLQKAAYERIIAKYAGALVRGGDKQNTPAAAAKTNEIAKLDAAQRPQGKYLVGQGNANIDVPQDAHIGREHAASVMPSNSPSGSNSVIAASKKTAGLSEEQELYVELFRKTAADVGPFLPATMTQEEKTAALQSMMPLDTAGRQAALDALYKTASGLPEALKELKAEKSEKAPSDEKDEKKKDDAPDESKKESALLTQIRNIAAQATR